MAKKKPDDKWAQFEHELARVIRDYSDVINDEEDDCNHLPEQHLAMKLARAAHGAFRLIEIKPKAQIDEVVWMACEKTVDVAQQLTNGDGPIIFLDHDTSLVADEMYRQWHAIRAPLGVDVLEEAAAYARAHPQVAPGFYPPTQRSLVNFLWVFMSNLQGGEGIVFFLSYGDAARMAGEGVQDTTAYRAMQSMKRSGLIKEVLKGTKFQATRWLVLTPAE